MRERERERERQYERLKEGGSESERVREIRRNNMRNLKRMGVRVSE